MRFCNQEPVTDDQFGKPFDKTFYALGVYDLSTGERVQELNVEETMGAFSSNSRYFITTDGRRFDLRSRSWAG